MSGQRTVGDVAKLARISVRALHHYDEIGLLRPSGRSPAGYRLYTDADLERLQHVLFFRELGFSLEDIARALADPGFDRLAALAEQRAQLVDKLDRTHALITLIDRTIHHLKEGTPMSTNELFDGFDPSQYDDEVKQRWGDTAAYAESKRRTGRYTKDDWARLSIDARAVDAAYVAALDAGLAPDSPDAIAAAERHRRHIDQWFYPCSHAMHEALGDGYVADERFTRYYDDQRPGLARFVCEAIHANARAARDGGDAHEP